MLTCVLRLLSLFSAQSLHLVCVHWCEKQAAIDFVAGLGTPTTGGEAVGSCRQDTV